MSSLRAAGLGLPSMGSYRADVSPTPCPCGSAVSFAECCEPVVTGQVQAATAEQLMRSRYTAYATNNLNHVFRTWNPGTRPPDLSLDPSIRWTGLTIHAAGPDWVQFTAEYRHLGQPGALVERSRFIERHGRWEYLDGEVG